MSTFRHGWHWLCDAPRHRTGLRALQIAIGLLLLFRVLTEAPFAGYFWGPHGVAQGTTAILLGARAGAVVDWLFFHSVASVLLLLAFVGLAGVALVLGRRTRAAAAIALVGFWAIELRMPYLCDGGDNVTRILLAYLLLVVSPDERPVAGSLRVFLHNLGVLAVAMQVMILYTTSGFMKAAGNRWHHGTALYLISQVEWFSLPGVHDVLKHPFLTAFATYATLLYQVWFPLAMFSRIKRFWLLGGIALHLSIAVVMGLVTFSTAMIGLELFLLTDAEWADVRARAARMRERLAQAIRRREPALVVYFDGACPLCVRTMRFWSALDVRRALRASSFRHDDEWRTLGVDAAVLERRMHVRAVASGRVVAGFEAVRAVARVVPLLWPVLPLLWLAAHAGIGDRAYDYVARRRRLGGAHCDGACTIARSDP